MYLMPAWLGLSGRCHDYPTDVQEHNYVTEEANYLERQEVALSAQHLLKWQETAYSKQRLVPKASRQVCI